MLPQYSRLGPDNTWIISVVNKITWFFSFLNNVWLWKLKFDLSRIINLNTDLADLQKNICWNRDMLHFLTFWVEGGYPPKVAIFFKMVGVIPPPPHPPLCREHVPTGRPHTRIYNSIFFSMKETENVHIQCIYVTNLCKSC